LRPKANRHRNLKPKKANRAKKKPKDQRKAEVKAQTKKRTNLVVAAMLVVVGLAAAFWMVLLSPKREEAQKLSGQIETVESSLSQHRSEAAAAAAAKRSFPEDYAHLVLIGKAVPSGDETASLLVQLNHLANQAEAKFETLNLEAAGEEVEASPEATAGTAASPTEAEASLLPLGASIGPAGLAVMPYSLTFEGDFFQIASFIEKLDNLVKTTNAGVTVNGRLITVGSFSLSPGEAQGDAARLSAEFSVTTYLTPPGEGLTAGASPSGPEEVTTLTSSTTGTAP
jgi:Tfp pilus assembly protein PilO